MAPLRSKNFIKLMKKSKVKNKYKKERNYENWSLYKKHKN